MTPDAAAPDAAVPTPPFAGAVLAGGRSRRFGTDKCGHPFRGRPLVEHALASLAGASERWIVGGPERTRDEVGWIRDEPPGRGPLAGVHAALQVVQAPWLAVVACDMPFVPRELWPHLLAEAGAARVVMPEGPTGLQPTAALYHASLRPVIAEHLTAGRGSPRALLDDYGLVVPWRDLRDMIPADAFLNVNRPEDLP